MKAAVKALARGAATALVMPAFLSFRVRSALMDENRALVGSSQLLSLIPGLPGQYLRRAFFALALNGGCAATAVIEFGVLFSQVGSRIDDNVYIGPRCHLGHVHLERGVLLGAGVHVPSGPHTHGTSVDRPIHQQEGALRLVRVGAGSWIGSGAIVLADVGRDTVVGAGAVVTQPLPDRVIAAGVPAKVVRWRDTPTSVTA
jgi:acetyltransferase-like isoleucine patch superfamily enzyme